ncbi:hypothetical protein Pla110_46110 [Polystyrenella longa]|uniref:DUF4350 domain-containing protein n=1 Tax=Polystyrenella longa TaxID=2528007 RepID=A0A518CUG3_9PLAN|nr:DUF4350 domain-containing protein [Polystyrenella longa]QDU82848.1 hypothetical protein Pla110_46110 [Polystyrenella longa]
MLILLQFWFPILDSGNTYDTRSTAARGKKAFFLLMQDQDFGIYRSDDSLSTMIDQLYWDETLLMLGPGRLPEEYHWNQILEWVRSGGTLFIAASYENPKLSIPELGISVVSDKGADEAEDEDSSSVMNPAAFGKEDEEEEADPEIQFCKSIESPLYESDKIAWAKGASLQLEGLAARNREVLVRTETGLQAIEMRLTEGKLIVLANDVLFSNQSIMNDDNAILAVKLLEKSIGENNEWKTICVDEWLNATAVPKVVGILMTLPFRHLTLLVLGLLWVFVWWKWFRFGPYLPDAESRRLNIVSHTDTVGTLNYQERLGRYALEGYWQQFQKEIHWSYQKQHRSRIISRISRRTGRTEDEVRILVNRTLEGIDNPNLLRADAANLIIELANLRSAIFA